jgi:hypothetical protein
MCFACRKTSPRYGDGEHLCSIAAMLHFGLCCGGPLDQDGGNENSILRPVQLGVLYASKKPITTYIVSVANSMLSIWLIFYW